MVSGMYPLVYISLYMLLTHLKHPEESDGGVEKSLFHN